MLFGNVRLRLSLFAALPRPAKPGLRPGLVSTLTTSMARVIALVMVLTTLLDIRRSRDEFRTDLAERGLLLAKTLSEVMAPLVYFADIDRLDSLTERISRSHPDLMHVRVFNNTGRVLAYQRSPRYISLPDRLEAKLMPPGAGLPSAKFGETGLEIFSPLSLGLETVGVLNLGFDETNLNQSIRQMVIQNILEVTFFIALVLILAYVIARHVTKPLKNLAHAASEFGQGNLDMPTPIQGTKEVSVLGHALESMRLELRSQYHGLEAQVAQRTRQLSITNEELKKESAERKNTEEQLAGLFEVSGAMGQPGSMIEKYRAVLKKVAQIAHADWISLRIAESDGLRLVVVEGHATREVPPKEYAVDVNSVSLQVFNSGRHMVVDLISADADIRASV